MLSLILIVIIVGNVVLWSYQMNKLDWEKMQEKITLTNAEYIARSSWFTSQNEYAINHGILVNGTYTYTWTVDGDYETFREESTYGLDIVAELTLDLSTYSQAYVNLIEVQIRYRANDSLENWFLKAYNWTDGRYSDVGFNSSAGDTPTTDFKYYAISLTNAWQSYVQSGMMRIEFCDNDSDINQTSVDIDFLGARLVVDGVKFSFENGGSLTSHVVAIWVINSTLHKRYDANFFLNSGEEGNYFRVDVSLPADNFTVRAVTDRGNIAVFASH
jgi:hypothetical protein